MRDRCGLLQRLSVRSVAVLLLACFVSALCHGDGDEASKQKRLMAGPDMLSGLETGASRDRVDEVTRRGREAPVHAKLVLVEALVPLLGRGERVETRGYEWKEGTHDLSRLAGRAAHVFEAVVGVELPRVEPTSTEAHLNAIQERAAAVVAGYRAGIEAVAAEYDIGESTESLKTEYGGKIKLGQSDQAYESALAMAGLLDRWFPIGKKAEDLETMVGSPNKPQAEGLVYWFHTGYFGWQFLFVVKEGVIESVVITGLD